MRAWLDLFWVWAEMQNAFLGHAPAQPHGSSNSSGSYPNLLSIREPRVFIS